MSAVYVNLPTVRMCRSRWRIQDICENGDRDQANVYVSGSGKGGLSFHQSEKWKWDWRERRIFPAPFPGLLPRLSICPLILRKMNPKRNRDPSWRRRRRSGRRDGKKKFASLLSLSPHRLVSAVEHPAGEEGGSAHVGLHVLREVRVEVGALLPQAELVLFRGRREGGVPHPMGGRSRTTALPPPPRNSLLLLLLLLLVLVVVVVLLLLSLVLLLHGLPLPLRAHQS